MLQKGLIKGGALIKNFARINVKIMHIQGVHKLVKKKNGLLCAFIYRNMRAQMIRR